MGRKGGVGKTTISSGLASVFASQGNQVLVVDLDPQSNSAYVLGVDVYAPGAADLLLGKQPEPLKADDGLFVLPGGQNLTDHRIQSLDPEDLRDAMRAYTFDVVVYDCPPGSEFLERQAIAASSHGLVVVDAHPLALLGARRVMEAIDLRKERGRRVPSKLGVVMSRMDSRRAADRDLPVGLEHYFPGVPRVTVRQDAAISAATSDSTPVMRACPTARAVEDLVEISRWLRG
jgi:chromosome partitioning protein